jgi:chromosome partitioning protein
MLISRRNEGNMTEIIALANQKGGVAKTTTTMSLGAGLVEQGYRVLLVDLDQQGSLTISAGIDPDSLETTMYNVLSEHANIKVRNPLPLSSVLLELEEGMWLAPSNNELAALDLELDRAFDRERVVQRALAPIMDRFDYVLIDCPPNLSYIVVNAFTAATRILIPLQADFLATKGVRKLMEMIEAVQARLNPRLEIVGILITMADTRTIHAREIIEAARTRYGATTHVFDFVIKYSVRLKEAPVTGWSILHYDSSGEAATAYRQLAREINGQRVKEASAHAS